MGRTQETEKTFVNIKKNDKGYPKFYIGGEEYNGVDGLPVYIKTMKKDVIPKQGKNIGKTITIKNLLLGIEEDDGTVLEVQFDLYGSMARNVLNSLAGADKLWKVYLSVYNNKKGFGCISIKKNNRAEDGRYTPFYTFEEEMDMVTTKVIQGETKKDYDAITDRYIHELLPIIEKKIAEYVPLDLDTDEDELFNPDTTPIVDGIKAKQQEDNDDLPF